MPAHDETPREAMMRRRREKAARKAKELAAATVDTQKRAAFARRRNSQQDLTDHLAGAPAADPIPRGERLPAPPEPFAYTVSARDVRPPMGEGLTGGVVMEPGDSRGRRDGRQDGGRRRQERREDGRRQSSRRQQQQQGRPATPHDALLQRKLEASAKRAALMREATRKASQRVLEATERNEAKALQHDHVQATMHDLAYGEPHSQAFLDGTTNEDTYQAWHGVAAKSRHPQYEAPAAAAAQRQQRDDDPHHHVDGLLTVTRAGELVHVPFDLVGAVPVSLQHIATPLTCVARELNGHVTCVDKHGGLVRVLHSGEPRLGAHLTLEGEAVRVVRALSFSPWLHANGEEQLFALVPAAAASSVTSDALCYVDAATGELEVLHLTRRHDVISMAAPPLANGPWHGVAFFLWTRTSGLVALSAANDGWRETRLGGSVDGLTGLAFSEDGHLFGTTRDAVYSIDHHAGSARRVGALPCAARDMVVVGNGPHKGACPWMGRRALLEGLNL